MIVCGCVCVRVGGCEGVSVGEELMRGCGGCVGQVWGGLVEVWYVGR